MPALDKDSLLSAVCPPLDTVLAEQLIDEFVSNERRYVLRDWGPAMLDGGQFAEAAARIIYHQDSGSLDRRRSVDRCLKYAEDPEGKNQHNYPSRKSALHSSRVIRTIYKFRSDRGAIHIDPEYSANQVDSKLVIECVRWLMAEILRLFWQKDSAAVAAAIRDIAQFEVPVIGEYEGRLLVERPDCTAEEEILILLHHAGEAGLSRAELGVYVQKAPSSVTQALTRLVSPANRQVVSLTSGNYRLTGLGVRRVLTQLSQKLL